MHYPLIFELHECDMTRVWMIVISKWNPVFPQSHLHKQVHCMPFLCPLCVLLLKVLLLLHLTWLLLAHLAKELPVLYQNWNFGGILLFLLLSSISGDAHQLIRLLKAFCTPSSPRISWGMILCLTSSFLSSSSINRRHHPEERELLMLFWCPDTLANGWSLGGQNRSVNQLMIITQMTLA